MSSELSEKKASSSEDEVSLYDRSESKIFVRKCVKHLI